MPFQLNEPMHYTYLLQSIQDGRWYTGATRDLRTRVRDHLEGRVSSTRYQEGRLQHGERSSPSTVRWLGLAWALSHIIAGRSDLTI